MFWSWHDGKKGYQPKVYLSQHSLAEIRMVDNENGHTYIHTWMHTVGRMDIVFCRGRFAPNNGGKRRRNVIPSKVKDNLLILIFFLEWQQFWQGGILIVGCGSISITHLVPFSSSHTVKTSLGLGASHLDAAWPRRIIRLFFNIFTVRAKEVRKDILIVCFVKAQMKLADTLKKLSENAGQHTWKRGRYTCC